MNKALRLKVLSSIMNSIGHIKEANDILNIWSAPKNSLYATILDNDDEDISLGISSNKDHDFSSIIIAETIGRIINDNDSMIAPYIGHGIGEDNISPKDFLSNLTDDWWVMEISDDFKYFRSKEDLLDWISDRYILTNRV